MRRVHPNHEGKLPAISPDWPHSTDDLERIQDAQEWQCAQRPGTVVVGFFASRCGLPDIPDAPGIRDLPKRQLSVALPWASRALGLPAPSVTG